MVRFQEKNKETAFLPDVLTSARLPCCSGDIPIHGFCSKPGFREDAWFMGCFDAGAFFIRKGQLVLHEGRFNYRREFGSFRYRYFTVSAPKTFSDCELIRFKYFAGGC